jgi:hypothetical protein
LGAFWHTEFGPLNQVIHVDPYEDLQQRTAVRAALGQDTARNQLPGGGDLAKWFAVGIDSLTRDPFWNENFPLTIIPAGLVGVAMLGGSFRS